MKLFIGWRLFLVSMALTVPFFAWSITRIIRSERFTDNCSFHADESLGKDYRIASDLSYAVKQLNLATSYLEKNGLTTGYTTIMGRSSSEDLSIFYDSLKSKASYMHDLQEMNSSSIEEYQKYASMRNLKAEPILVPDGISVFPHNVLYMIWGVISSLLAILGVAGIVTLIDQRASVR